METVLAILQQVQDERKGGSRFRISGWRRPVQEERKGGQPVQEERKGGQPVQEERNRANPFILNIVEG